MTGLLLGIFGIANGYNTLVTTREVPVVAKHQTLERDPSRRANYVAVRASPNSRDVVELGAPIEVYDQLNVPLTTIHARQTALDEMSDAGTCVSPLAKDGLVAEWLKGIALP